MRGKSFSRNDLIKTENENEFPSSPTFYYTHFLFLRLRSWLLMLLKGVLLFGVLRIAFP